MLRFQWANGLCDGRCGPASEPPRRTNVSKHFEVCTERAPQNSSPTGLEHRGSGTSNGNDGAAINVAASHLTAMLFKMLVGLWSDGAHMLC